MDQVVLFLLLFLAALIGFSWMVMRYIQRIWLKRIMTEHTKQRKPDAITVLPDDYEPEHDEPQEKGNTDQSSN